jgi:hypothetical protein
MKIFFLATAVTVFVLSARSQTNKKLDEVNGFKNYKLGSKYQPAYGIKGKQEDFSDKVTISGNSEKIGEVTVSRIELIYAGDSLGRIVVYAEPHQHKDLLESCKNFFGEPFKDLSDNEASRQKSGNTGGGLVYTNNYLWKSSKLSLEYLYKYPKIEGGAYGVKELFLVYTVNNFQARLDRAKKKKIKPGDF